MQYRLTKREDGRYGVHRRDCPNAKGGEWHSTTGSRLKPHYELVSEVCCP